MLGPNWYMENMIDYEYQYYRLMHYSQTVKKRYMEMEIYPYLKNTIDRFNEAEYMLSALNSIPASEINDEIESISKILEQAKEVFYILVNEGVGLYETIKKFVKIEPLRIIYPNLKEGIMICHIPYYPYINIFKYSCERILVKDDDDKYVFATHIEKILEIFHSYKRIIPDYNYLLGQHNIDKFLNAIICYSEIFIPISQIIEIAKRTLPVFVFEHTRDFELR